MGNTASCCTSSAGNEKPEVTVATSAPSSTAEDVKQASAESETPRCVLRFVLPDGSSKEIVFTQRPLGIDFSRSLPLTCKRLKPDLQGEKKEVKIGWCVSHINDQPLPVTFEETLGTLTKAVSVLPSA
ncbi:unnamed protein product [Effrenium voratum]|uniref:Uncharacterized protein n=1 Tax=Effrenium voratum TaxID=2562239 RepID=A0AA36HRN3_9DINO|nr:unnamed protein product [Effrenium voratum]CAJ1373525.1 unnamed protein product [Effrenium voratum]CAJ1449363.1 unnamed protein product [Effrenium voratum]